MKVRRVLIYEGSEQRVRDTLSRSLRKHTTTQYGNLKITVYDENVLSEDFEVGDMLEGDDELTRGIEK